MVEKECVGCCHTEKLVTKNINLLIQINVIKDLHFRNQSSWFRRSILLQPKNFSRTCNYMRWLRTCYSCRCVRPCVCVRACIHKPFNTSRTQNTLWPYCHQQQQQQQAIYPSVCWRENNETTFTLTELSLILLQV